MNDNTDEPKLPITGKAAFVIAVVFVAAKIIVENFFHEIAVKYHAISEWLAMGLFLSSLIALEEFWRGLRLRKQYYISLMQLEGREKEFKRREEKKFLIRKKK